MPRKRISRRWWFRRTYRVEPRGQSQFPRRRGGGGMNIYDEILHLPRHHRLSLARWILRTNSVGYDERERVMGRQPRTGGKRVSKANNNSMKVTA